MIKRSMLLPLLLAAGVAQAAQQLAEAAPQAAALTAAALPATEKVDVAKGQQIATTVCAACHAPDGNSQIPANPKLAAQHPAYLYKQLKNFKAEGGKQPERVSPVMNGMVAALSDEDMKNVAAYYASQAVKGDTAKNQETIMLGQKLYRAGDAAKGLPACAACHGPAGSGIPAQFPRVGGQFAEYTEAQLKAFRDGTRANDPNKMMRAVALKMTDAEIKAVADYMAGLR
ncbi:MAG: c-type cytochrome [Pseudomonadota bacterium]